MELFSEIKQTEINILECTYFKINSEYKAKKLQVQELKINNSRKILFTFEDYINKERREFAKKYKTFFEKSGGSFGFSGYLTIFYHHTKVFF